MSMFEEMARGAHHDTMNEVAGGHTILYKANDTGSGVAIDACWSEDEFQREDNSNGMDENHYGVIDNIHPDDVPDPSGDDTFVIVGEEWAVSSFVRVLPLREIRLVRVEEVRLDGGFSHMEENL